MSENEATNLLVQGLSERLNSAEDELGRVRAAAKTEVDELRRQLQGAEAENHALRSRLTAVALVIRP